jgi:hemerythrin superfamily protein
MQGKLENKINDKRILEKLRENALKSSKNYYYKNCARNFTKCLLIF